jgi:hypothetical protein
VLHHPGTHLEGRLWRAVNAEDQVQAMNFYRFSDGQIVEERATRSSGFLQQVGAVPWLEQ